jgi:molecular chaperone HtpG
MQRIQQLLGRETMDVKRSLELNRAHPLMAHMAQRTATRADDPVTAAIIEQLYDNALLLEGLHTNPTSMVARIQTLLEAAARAEPQQ